MIRFGVVLIPALMLVGCMSQQPAPTVDRTSSTASKAAGPQPAGPGYYTVKRGDTLYRIALEHGQDHRDIAAWNAIANPSSIREGQVLRVIPPGAAEPAEGAVTKPIATGSGVESRPLDQTATGSAATTNGLLKREPRVGKEPYSDEAYARLNRLPEMPPPAEAKPDVKPQTTAPNPAPAMAGPDDVFWMWPTTAKVSAPYNESGNKGLDFAGKAGDPVLAAGDGKVVYAGSGLRGFGELVIVKHNATYLSAYAHNRKILVREGQQVTRGQKIAEMGNTDSDSVKLHFEIRKQGKPVDPALYLPKR
ncbi:MAG: peptidoglycan DD-metalloendopeptidase family protein [Azonexus sp.]